jgi:hypothetical protein
MQRLTGFLVVGAVAAAADGRPSARTPGRRSRTKGDCVNDGAQGLAAQPGPLDPQTVCLSIPGRPSFTNGTDGSWTCRYLTPPGPAQPTSLEEPCGAGEGSLQVSDDDGLVVATCYPGLAQANG